MFSFSHLQLFYVLASDQPVCGNQIIEGDEQCDCGFADDCVAVNDTCCGPADGNEQRRCKLLKGECR